MVTEKEVINSLENIPVAGVMRSVMQMNLVRNVSISSNNVEITLTSTAITASTQEWLETQVKSSIGKLDGVKEVTVNFLDSDLKNINEIGSVIPVMSGKGGVGKSLVTGLLAVALRRQGYEVGILDADITGPSIPKMFGITERPSGNEKGILPVSSASGIELISINLLLPNVDDAVIWRGPLIGKAITQFWEEVLWGKLDYLLIDLPPGTADAPLTVLQVLPVSGVVIVFTPQDLTTMIVRKAVQMTRQMKKPIVGVIENMSYLYVPEIDKRIKLFGESRAEEMSAIADAPLLGKIPIDPNLASLCDAGKIETYDNSIVQELGERLLASAARTHKREVT